MKRKRSSLDKYRYKRLRRNLKEWWWLRSNKRYSEANRILRIYRYPPFWIPVIGLLILYAIFWWPSDVGERKGIVPVSPSDSVIESNIDWESIRNAARSRRSNVNFHEAKRKLYRIYWDLDLTKTFYCGCDFTLTPKRHDRESCNLVMNKYKRAHGLDAEHIVPESFVGRDRACWRSGGRKECKNDAEHQLAAGDLHNLVPSVPGINRLRSNFMPVDELPGEAHEFGACDVEIERGSFEPPPEKRGDIARTYLYMWKVYNAPLTADDVAMFERWHREDPPDDDEIAIARAKAEVQGNSNPLVAQNF